MSTFKSARLFGTLWCCAAVILCLSSSAGWAESSRVKLTPKMPVDVNVSNPIGNYADFNLYSWLSFVALNWPSGPDGQPDNNKIIGQDGDNPTVWETWMEDYQILVGNGETPPAWNALRAPPPSCLRLNAKPSSSRAIHHVSSKTGAVVSLSEQAQAGPLIDQNGAYVRYEILFNEVMYNYIVENQLYNLTGISAISEINFPEGALATEHTGSTEVKASWKVLGTGDDPSRFHTSTSYVYDASNKSCAVETLGLVGFHIATKTENAPQWIWSTFEHVDNAPDQGDLDPSHHYSFISTFCQENPDNCAFNQEPEMPWDPTKPGQIPVQVTREVPIDATTNAINADFQEALKAINSQSVWGNYQLVGTQYPQKPNDPTDPQGRPFPAFLANTSMETFLQGEVPTTSSSCIGCHARATAGNSAKPTDFTYILSRVTAKD